MKYTDLSDPKFIKILEEQDTLMKERDEAFKLWEADPSNERLFNDYKKKATQWKKHLDDNTDILLAKIIK